MRARLWMCFPFLLLISAGPATRSAEERGAAGELRARHTLSDDGTRNGAFTAFYPDGKTKEAGSYRNGQLDGMFTAYHPSGKPSLRCTYRAGSLDGSYVTLDEAGRKTASIDYKAGKRHGFTREYIADKIVVEKVYIEDTVVYPRSPAVIAAALAEIRQAKVETVPAAETIPPHKGEPPKDAADAVRLLMEYRYLSNVPWELSLDARYNAHDEAAAAILAELGRLSHDPANPGWPEAEFKFAHKGCASSNIYMGSARASSAIRSFMNDSDPSNIDRVGHRRWCLNPAMGKLGLGSSGRYVAMWSMDNSRKDVPEFEFVAYPAAGLYPTTHFDSSAAWSVSLNPRKYSKPDKGNVKVSVKTAQVVQSPLGIKTGEELPLNYFAVETSGFGIPNAIIFRPERCSTKPGSAYQVEITGLQIRGKDAASIKYVVEFYTPAK